MSGQTDASEVERGGTRPGVTFTVTFGRQMIDGKPTGEGITLPVDSPTLDVLQTATTPLYSNPVLEEYGAGLVLASDSGGEYERGIGISPPGNDGPAEHVHPNYDERFEVVEGEYVFELDGETRVLEAGEEYTVGRGTPHAFRNESDAVASCLIETHPAGELQAVLSTLFGLAHDGRLRADGQPGFWQGMVLAEAYGDDTVFTSPPPVLQKAMATVFGPIGRLLGYRATYPEYEPDGFWIEHVEQPPELQAR